MTARGRLWNAWMAIRARNQGVWPDGRVMPARWEDLPRHLLYLLPVAAAFHE